MNYANMIEEKNLKKVFIMATLVSTIVGTFTSSLGLYERVQQRRQQKTDKGQDQKLSQLQKQLEEIEQRSRRNTEEQKKFERKKDELEESLEKSGPMIKHEFDRDVQRLGKQFAIGDTISQTQLQAQIIALQQTVISVLENALYNNRNINQVDLAKLFQASEAAREGSLGLLHDQYQRMLTAAPVQGSPAPTKRTQRALPPGASSSPSLIDTSPLFCRYSVDLQKNPNRPLASNLQPGGDNACPACDTRLAIEQGRVWKIIKEIERVKKSTAKYDDILIEERTFHLSNRFVVKCHRDNGQFACVLCNRNRDVDTVWETANSLVKHVWRAHESEEYGADPDIREIG